LQYLEITHARRRGIVSRVTDGMSTCHAAKVKTHCSTQAPQVVDAAAKVLTRPKDDPAWPRPWPKDATEAVATDATLMAMSAVKAPTGVLGVVALLHTQTPEVANAVDNATTMTTTEVIGAVALLHADVHMNACMHACTLATAR
jgi:hypothetical protein